MYNVTYTKDIVIVTFKNIPDDILYISKVFNLIKKNEINIDLITKEMPINDKTGISFSFNRCDISKVVNIIKDLKEVIPSLYTEILSDVTKITYKYEESNFNIFEILNKEYPNSKIISKGENEISIWINN